MVKARFSIGFCALLANFMSPINAQSSDLAVHGVVFSCTRADGSVVFTNVDPAIGNISPCVGWTTERWRQFYSDQTVALLINDYRTRVSSPTAASWIMYYFYKRVADKRYAQDKSFDRIVSKVTVDCNDHDLTITSSDLYQVDGPNVVQVGNGRPVQEKVPPNSVEDKIVAEVCKGPPQLVPPTP